MLFKKKFLDVIKLNNGNWMANTFRDGNVNYREKKGVPISNEGEIKGAKQVIENQSLKFSNETELFFDTDIVLNFEDVLIFHMASRPCQKYFFKKNIYKCKLIVIDKVYGYLIIFSSHDDMMRYLSGSQNYSYYYKTLLNTFVNISKIKKKSMYSSFTNYFKKDKEKVYKFKIILNDVKEALKYNYYKKSEQQVTHINDSLPLYQEYEFATLHHNKAKLFVETIQEVCGYKCIIK